MVIRARVEQGILRPLGPLLLEEGQEVSIEVLPDLSGYLGVVTNPEALSSVEWQHRLKEVWAGRYGPG